ncbi:MAG: energy-coupling factor transporter transmembrane protein EcfT [Mycoplasma sp.]|nr:energy-coupling factor transporter transmembrane protein EcfT [Mycoplasma sp.]
MEMTVGQYIEDNSIIHRLDPRVKIFANISLIVLVFLSKSYLTYALLFTPILISYLFARLKIRKLISMLKPVIFICAFLFIINIFIIKINKTTPELGWFSNVSLWNNKINISDVAVDKTAIIGVRVYLMIIITTILTSTTKPTDLTKGIEDVMSPLKLVRFPVHIVAMIISIALRFIPTLLEEAQRIMKAQASRGVDFKNGGIRAKVKSTVTLIIPLFVTSFSKAEDLGNAMETRGYDPYAKRNRYRDYSIKIFDVFVFTFISVFIVFISYIYADVISLPLWWK